MKTVRLKKSKMIKSQVYEVVGRKKSSSISNTRVKPIKINSNRPELFI